MSTLIAKGNWNIAKGKFKQAWARMTHDHLRFVQGQVDELVGRIQKRRGRNRRNFERSAGAADYAYRCGHR